MNQVLALFGLLAIYFLICICTEEMFNHITRELRESMKNDIANELILTVQAIIPFSISIITVIPLSIFSCLYSAMCCSTMNFLMNEKETTSNEPNEIKNFTLTELNKDTNVVNTEPENIMEVT